MSRKFSFLLFLVILACAVAMTSCSPKFSQGGGTVPLSPGQEEISINDEDGVNGLSAYKSETENGGNISIEATAAPEEVKIEFADPLEKDPPDETPLTLPETTASQSEETEQWILDECRDYFEKLNNDPETNAGKIACLQAAEEIINPADTEEELSKPLDIRLWQEVLSRAFNLDSNEVVSYTVFGSNDVLTWDVAAISIFKLGFRINAFDIRDASAEEIESARSAVSGFDSAMDISKFAQMYSSGLINGIYEKPGFAPGNAVTKGEALLLAKRMVEHLP